MAVEEAFDIPRPSGRILPGTLTPAPGPLVLLLHGMVCGRNHNFAPALAAALAAAGFACLRFDFRPIPPSPLEPAHRFRINGAEDDVDDLVHVAAACAARLGRPVSALVGHSRGANAALLFAGGACGAALPAVVSIAARFDMTGMLRGRILTPPALAALEAGGPPVAWATRGGEALITCEDVAAIKAWGDMAGACGAIPCSTGLFFLHGSKDVNIPLEDARSFHAARPDSELLVVEGAAHNFAKFEGVLIESVVAYLRKRLQVGEWGASSF